jgi:hypothetical protein
VSVEQLLRQTLHRADTYEVSPDLFARVQRSIDEDLAHRRRVRLAVGWTLAGVLSVVVYLVAMAEVVDGRVSWPWWSLELLTAAILIVLILVVGPLIRRFGGIYASSVFAARPRSAQTSSGRRRRHGRFAAGTTTRQMKQAEKSACGSHHESPSRHPEHLRLGPVHLLTAVPPSGGAA